MLFCCRSDPVFFKPKYSLRPIIFFAKVDVSSLVIDTSVLAKINMGQREYYFRVSKNPKNNSGCSQWCMPQSCKLSTENNLYFDLNRNNKIMDLSIAFSSLQTN
jgi:hypothetical protein